MSKCNLSELVSDHYHVENIKPILPKKLITYRKVTQINLNDFISDIRSNFKKDTSIHLIDIFEMTFNEPAPIKSLLITERINNHWYNYTYANSKGTLQKQEHTYRFNKTSTKLYNFTDAQRTHNRLLHTIRSNYYNNCIEYCNHDLKSIFVLCNKFLGRNIIRVLPDCHSVESFSNFFNTKDNISSLSYHYTQYLIDIISYSFDSSIFRNL